MTPGLPPSATPTTSPSVTARPTFTAELWAFVLPPSTELVPVYLARDRDTNDLYLPLNKTLDDMTGQPPRFASQLIADYQGGFGWPNVASQGSDNDVGDILTYYRYLKLFINSTTSMWGADLWTATGAFSVVGNPSTLISGWGEFKAIDYAPYATAACCHGDLPCGFANIDLTGTIATMPEFQFGIAGLTAAGQIYYDSPQVRRVRGGHGHLLACIRTRALELASYSYSPNIQSPPTALHSSSA